MIPCEAETSRYSQQSCTSRARSAGAEQGGAVEHDINNGVHATMYFEGETGSGAAVCVRAC